MADVIVGCKVSGDFAAIVGSACVLVEEDVGRNKVSESVSALLCVAPRPERPRLLVLTSYLYGTGTEVI